MGGTPLRIAVFVVFASLGVAGSEYQVRGEVDELGGRLESIAAEAAGLISTSEHVAAVAGGDPTSPAFIAVRDSMRRSQDRHRMVLKGTDIYTFTRTDSGCAFGVMTNPDPFLGEPYACLPFMDEAWAGRAAASGLYRSPNGRWISGVAPIVDAEGTVVAILEADVKADRFAQRRVRGAMLALILGLFAAGLACLPPGAFSSAEGFGHWLRRLFLGRLAARIGLGGSVAVVLAVTVVGVLDHREDRADLMSSVEARLLATVELAALGIDPALHEEVAAAEQADSDAFRTVREHLRAVRSAARLTTPVYTMRRDGRLLRFVVMTNEVPFVGDPYPLREGHQRTFETGESGTEGPYADAHGTWMSAWAPVRDEAGRVIAVVQADEEMSALMERLENAALRSLLFALLGVVVAFAVAGVVGRGIARPVRQVAIAAGQVGRGEFEVDVPEQREDEVGDLARSVALMAGGLADRERLRDMFGKYMAGQVAQVLMDGDQAPTLEGESREITVVLTDIRGYTALTEELGAEEIVQLLNEYFTILVDAVIEHEGVVDKFMGDAMLCWFGAPVPQEDHRGRAVAAAIKMMDEAAAWNARRVAEGKKPVRTGVGIASGAVIVGNIGSERRLEYTAIGDAVNLASRLCSKADAGEVIASEEVALASGAPFERVGPVTVKGVSEPVVTHRLTVPIVAG